MQIELFRGPHLPLIRCLAALEEGDVRGAREALADLDSDSRATADRTRLGLIEARVPALGAGLTISPEEVHAAFAAALEPQAPSNPGAIPTEAWFRLYARHVAATLETGASACFRNWYGLHFELAAGRSDAALRRGQRLLATCDEGWAALEAARAAWVAGEEGRAARLVLVACLKLDGDVSPAPPRISTARTPALNPPPGLLPRLPRRIEDLWDHAEALGLPPPASAWVPAVGIIDGIFSQPLLGWSVELEGSGFDPAGPVPADEQGPRAFLRALLAARQARALAPGTGGAGYGEAELAARLRMKRIAPELLARYLARLGGVSTRP